MRIAVLALLLASPLLAGEETRLAQSVEAWRSGNTSERDAASLKAENEMRRLLAPLLEALGDKDPEVRRRAKRTLVKLLPRDAEEEQPAKFVRDERERLQMLLARQVMFAARAAQMQAAARAAAKKNAKQGRGLDNTRKELDKLRNEVNRIKKAELREMALRAGLDARQRKRAELVGLAAQVQQALGVKLSDTPKGPLVAQVTRGGMAERLGIAADDLLVEIDGVRVLNVAQLVKQLGKKPDWSRVRFKVTRGSTALGNHRIVRLPEK